MKTGEKVKKPKKRRISVFTIMIFILLIGVVGAIAFNMITNKNAVEADHVLTKESEDVEVVNYGTTTSGDYAFSLRANESTTIELWGDYKGKVIERNNAELQPQTQGYAIMPTDDSLSGKIGCWFRNVGSYEGKTINLKCTYYWYPLEADGKAVHPYIEAAIEDVTTNNKEGKIGFNFSNNSIKVKFDLYEEGDDENPVAVNMSLTFGDIDGTQYYGFRMNENGGTINKIQCPSDATTFYKKMVSQNEYDDNKEFYWIYSNSTSYSDTLNATVRFELKDASSFTIIYGSELDHKSHTFLNRSEATDTERGHSEELVYARYESLKEQFDNEILWPESKTTADNGNTYLFTNDCLYWGYFNGFAYGPYELPKPTKLVNDRNQRNTKTNDLEQDGEKLWYTISQQVPLESTSYYYTSFVIKDTLPDCIVYNSAKVINEAGKDVTSNFDITTSVQNGRTTVTATAKASILNNIKFYNNEYTLRIDANLKENPESTSDFIKVSDNQYKFTNTANVTVERDEGTTTKNSNTVTTNYKIRKLIGTVFEDANQNGQIDSNEAVFKDITVRLLDSDLNEVTDINGNKVASVKTDANGKYEFTKLVQGKYVVEFSFGDKKTTYLATDKEKVDDINVNSRINAIDVSTGIAVTDKLEGLNTKDSILEVANAGIYKKAEKTVKVVNAEDRTTVMGGEELEYTITYKNETSDNETVEIIDDIPEGTKYSGGVKVTINDVDSLAKVDVTEPTDSINKISIKTKSGITVKPNETIKLTYKVKVKTVEEGLNINVITNVAEVVHNEHVLTTTEVKTPVEVLPTKRVSDSDETNQIANTLQKTTEDFTYDIYQQVLSMNKAYYYDSFVIKDTLPDCVNYVSSKIYDKDGKDVTELFNITTSGQTITATLKDTKSDSFYNNTYDWKVSVNLKVDQLEKFKVSDNEYKFTNKANVIVERAGDKITKESNTVTTNYKIRKLIGTVFEDANQNGQIDSNETLFKDITVRLLDSNLNEVTDINGNKVASVKTDANGKYEFTKLVQGEYVVEFSFGDKKTTYLATEKEKVDDINVNSRINAIDVSTGIAVTDKLEGLNTKDSILEVANAGIYKKAEKTVRIVTDDNRDTVREGEELEYTIKYKNQTTVEETIKITDPIPEYTTFVSGSVTIAIDGTNVLDKFDITNPTSDKNILEAATKNGVTLKPNQELVFKFKVKVNENLDPIKIKNKGIVIHNDKELETNEVQTPVEALPKKSVNIGNGIKTAQGNKLIYTITYKNITSADETVEVIDAVPVGTKYVGEVVAKIDGNPVEANVTEPQNGADTGEIKVSPKVKLKDGETLSVSFTVKVKTLAEGLNVDKIVNDAIVKHYSDPNKVSTPKTNEVQNPIDNKPKKDVDVGDGTGVKEGDILTYTIDYVNLSDVDQKIVISDKVPEGTKYVGDITVTIDDKDVLANMILTEPEVGADEGDIIAQTDDTLKLKNTEKISLTFKVQVKTVKEGLKINEITNIAKVKHNENVQVTNDVGNPVDTVPSKDVDVGNLTGVKPGQIIEYSVDYTNLDDEEKTITVMDEVPEGTKYVGEVTASIINDASEKTDVLEKMNVIEPKSGADTGDIIFKTKDGVTLKKGETIVVTFKVQIKTVKEGLKVDNIINTADVEHTGIASGTSVTDTTNQVENPVSNPKKEVDVGNGKSVKEGEVLEYKITYKNFGKIGETIKITDALPEGTVYVGEETAYIEDVDVLTSGDVKVAFVDNQVVFETADGVLLNEGETIVVTFKVRVKTAEEGLNVDIIRNVADVEHNGKVERTNEVENPISPNLIDTSDINLWIYVAVAIVAIIGIIVVLFIMINNKKKK